VTQQLVALHHNSKEIFTQLNHTLHIQHKAGTTTAGKAPGTVGTTMIQVQQQSAGTTATTSAGTQQLQQVQQQLQQVQQQLQPVKHHHEHRHPFCQILDHGNMNNL
jgi:hypothetical protein